MTSKPTLELDKQTAPQPGEAALSDARRKAIVVSEQIKTAMKKKGAMLK